MNFLLYRNARTNLRPQQLNIVHDIKNIMMYKNERNPVLYLEKNLRVIKTVDKAKSRLIAVGDLIIPLKYRNVEKDYLSQLSDNFTIEKFRKLKGFFYLILFDETARKISIYNSIFSLLPIYYYNGENSLIISSSKELILQVLDTKVSIDKKFILEQTLFNYSLSNRTHFNEIKLLPANSLCLIKESFDIKRHTDLEKLFQSNPISWKRKRKELAELFINETKEYFPDEKFYLSFTGGFDGRTLVSVAKHYNKDFNTYSFGNSESKDMLLPKEQAEQLGFPFHPVILDEDYINNHSVDCGIKFIELTEGNASISRAHYLYAMSIFQKQTQFIITGNFGSELFRAFHNVGAVFTKELYDIFMHDDWQSKISTSPKLKLLNLPEYLKEFEELIEEISDFKAKIMLNTPRNQALYKFVLEEAFRKYFGPEIVMESYFLYNRTPYLNYIFILELFKTSFAGVYSDFFENKPLKRYKGQVLYAEIIKRCYPDLFKLKTVRGYRPLDLLSISGKFNIAFNYFVGKSFKKNYSVDPLSVKKAFLTNYNAYQKWNFQADYYNKEFIKQQITNSQSLVNFNTLLIALSTNYYLSKYF